MQSLQRWPFWTWLFICTVSLVIHSVGLAQSPAAFIETMEGAGQAQVGRYPSEELAHLQRSGQLTPRHLENVGALPNWVYSLVEGMRTDGLHVWELTEQRMAAQLLEMEHVLVQIRPGMLELQRWGEHAPPELQEGFAQNMEILERTERLVKDLARLLRYMESKDYVTWQPAAVGLRLQEGDVLVAGDGTEVTVRYDLGAVARLQSGASLSVWRPSVQRPSAGEVTTRLWRGIVNFYWPPGTAGQREFEVETNMVRTGIRGTEFVMEHDLGQTNVRVHRGEVAVTLLATGETTILGPGQFASFGPAGRGAASAAVPSQWERYEAGPYVTWARPPHWATLPDVPTFLLAEDLENFTDLQAVVGWLDWPEVAAVLADDSLTRTTSFLAGRHAYHFANPMDVPPGFNGELYVILDPTPEGELLAVAAAWGTPEARTTVEQVLASIELQLPGRATGVQEGAPTTISPESPVSTPQSVAQQLDAIDRQISGLVVEAQQTWAAHPDLVQELHSFRVQLLPVLRDPSANWNPHFVDTLREMVQRAEAQLLAHPTYRQSLHDLLADLTAVAHQME